jgi:hypothetical protein
MRNEKGNVLEKHVDGPVRNLHTVGCVGRVSSRSKKYRKREGIIYMSKHVSMMYAFCSEVAHQRRQHSAFSYY